MKEKFKNLNDSFNVSSDLSEIVNPISENVIKSEIEIEKSIDIENEIIKDYEYTRGNLYSLIEKGQQAINGILELAQESEMPRAYEVAGQLIKNVGDVADKLMDLQKKLKTIDEVKMKSPTNVTNALFVGSTAELSKFLKSQNQK